MKRALVVCILMIVSSCAPVPKGEPVPIKLVYGENAGKRFECFEYEASSDTCEALAMRKVRGNQVDYRADFIMPRLPGVPGIGKVTMSMPLLIEGDRYCGNFRQSDVKITGLPSSYATDLAIALKVELAKDGDICTQYYHEDFGYLSVTTKRDGTPIRDGIGRVVFVERPKALRRVVPF
ncbi:MAG: hypothetical protein AAGK71_15435 [Pseudomonadota bacterium]